MLFRKINSTLFRHNKYFWSKLKTNFGEYDVVKPGNVSDFLEIPEHIPKPEYYLTGDPGPPPQDIEIKTKNDILRMKRSCKLAANILEEVRENIKIGLTTDEIDKFVHKITIENGAYPSPYNYRNFPKSVCTSVNNVVCHGIPDDRPLKDGDIINVDVTVFFEGFHGDCSRTCLVGNVDNFGKALVEITEEILNNTIELCKPNTNFKEIGKFISRKSKKMGYSVIPAFVGHGLGSYFHGPPDIFHIENNYPGNMLPGMTFTIEPILGQGTEVVDILEDGWTAVTIDDSRTAQFEHTVLITDDGVEILTLPD